MTMTNTTPRKKNILSSNLNILNPKKMAKREKANRKQQNKHKAIRRGINMSDEQKLEAQKVKEDIINLYKEGYSIRMITDFYNNLYSIRNSQGHIMKEAISRETVRKILNNQEVSLKVIIGNPYFQNTKN